jgi:hypothetical protein
MPSPSSAPRASSASVITILTLVFFHFLIFLRFVILLGLQASISIVKLFVVNLPLFNACIFIIGFLVGLLNFTDIVFIQIYTPVRFASLSQVQGISVTQKRSDASRTVL